MAELPNKNYITPEGFAKLREEYQNLMLRERPRVVETVAWAASNGDRSENADYLYGKKRLREIDRRLKFLKGRLEVAEVVDPTKSPKDRVFFGATVTLVDDNQKEKKYLIVGEDEFDLSQGKISWRSPMAKALLGKKEGDEVQIQTPQGVVNYLIDEIY